jgi:hypothetical protein
MEKVIEELPDPSIQVVLPLSVTVESDSAGCEFVAQVPGTTMAMSGETPEIATQELASYIADTFLSLLDEESSLGPGPKKDLEVLRRHLARVD